MAIPRRTLLVSALIVVVIVGFGLVIAEDKEVLRVRTPLSADDPRLPAYIARLIAGPVSFGDRYAVFDNGAALDAMIDAIQRARERINLETYIYSPGVAATRFTAARSAAAQRGVRVQIVLDAVGASDAQEEVEKLKHAGCVVGWFHPMRHYGIEEMK